MAVSVETRKAQKAAWSRNNPTRRKYYVIKHRYGLTPEEYDKLIAGGCHACGGFEDLHIDHDHSCCPTTPTCSRCLRGVLCQGCNHAAGYLKNDAERASLLAGYLAGNGVIVHG